MRVRPTLTAPEAEYLRRCANRDGMHRCAERITRALETARRQQSTEKRRAKSAYRRAMRRLLAAPHSRFRQRDLDRAIQRLKDNNLEVPDG